MNQFKLILFAFVFSSLLFVSCDDCEFHDESGIYYLSLKPDNRDSKDAVIWTERPDTPAPYHQDFQAMGWTWYAYNYDGGIRRSLIEFDLADIPRDAKIMNATLNLYFNPTSPELPSTYGHSQRDGSNRSTLYRITSPWSDKTVTWNNQPNITNKNRVSVKASDFPEENYQIDVRKLVEDMVENPDESFGFMYMLDNEDYYRAMIFASGDHENSNLHPELNIQYEVR